MNIFYHSESSSSTSVDAAKRQKVAEIIADITSGRAKRHHIPGDERAVLTARILLDTILYFTKLKISERLGLPEDTEIDAQTFRSQLQQLSLLGIATECAASQILKRCQESEGAFTGKPAIRQLRDLLERHGVWKTREMAFSPAQGFAPNWKKAKPQDRVSQQFFDIDWDLFFLLAEALERYMDDCGWAMNPNEQASEEVSRATAEGFGDVPGLAEEVMEEFWDHPKLLPPHNFTSLMQAGFAWMQGWKTKATRYAIATIQITIQAIRGPLTQAFYNGKPPKYLRPKAQYSPEEKMRYGAKKALERMTPELKKLLAGAEAEESFYREQDASFPF